MLDSFGRNPLQKSMFSPDFSQTLGNLNDTFENSLELVKIRARRSTGDYVSLLNPTFNIPQNNVQNLF